MSVSPLRLKLEANEHVQSEGVTSKFWSLSTNNHIYIYLLLASFARSVRQVMDRVFSFLLWPKRQDVYYMALLIIPVLKRYSRARGPYGYLRTWN